MPGLDVATAFAQRINFGQQPADSIRYGNEHVERMIIRGVQPDYAAALPLFTVAARALHFAVRRGARAQCGGDRQRALPIRCFRTPTRSAKKCG